MRVRPNEWHLYYATVLVMARTPAELQASLTATYRELGTADREEAQRKANNIIDRVRRSLERHMTRRMSTAIISRPGRSMDPSEIYGFGRSGWVRLPIRPLSAKY